MWRHPSTAHIPEPCVFAPFDTQAPVAQLACVRKADMRYDFKEAVLRIRCELAYIRDDR